MSRDGQPESMHLWFDPGWLFLIAGLVLVASAVLVPANYDLWTMRAQRQHLVAQEEENDRRIEAYTRFMAALQAGDPQLVRRLAASQLNRIPKGETPLLLAATVNQTPLDWIEASVTPVVPKIRPFTDSLLSRLTLGRKALWVAGAGVMCIFLGILLAPLQVRVRKPELEEARARAGHLFVRAMVGPQGGAGGVSPEVSRG